MTRNEPNSKRADAGADVSRAAAPRGDHGRERMVRNVLSSWGSQLILIIAGFVLPRMIDERLGQSVLGVWDFAWSLVTYFGLVQGGIVSSINRYVARHRGAGDIEAMNCAVSSVTVVLMIMAAVVVALSAGLALLLPALWSERLGPHLVASQWVVFFLGLSLAVQVAGAAFGGVITGCHRWDWHNGIYGATAIGTTTAMIVALILGGGLVWLALIQLAGEIVGRVVRVGVAYRVCPELSIEFRRARRPVALEMLAFGQKSFVPFFGELLANQTVSVIVLSLLGPAALAVFSRPRGLVRHVSVLVARFANVLSPTASSLQATQSPGELRDLAIKATRYGLFLAWPMILGLVLLGDVVMRVWMGANYDHGALVAVMSLGGLAAIVVQPLYGILMGVNAHGRPGVATLIASIASAVLVWPAVTWLGDGLLGAALAVSIPATIASGVYTPWYACRVLGLPFLRFIRETCWLPLMCSLPLVATSLAARWLFSAQPKLALLFTAAVGGLLLAAVYWRCALPPSLRQKLVERFASRRAAGSAA